ncbi:MAG: hypothetical protein O7G85_07115 [Planctomycetota bacterium]|nr:hypothetical protein [Planctomycetota bacterium]
MSILWKKLTYFAFVLPNRPGELARFTTSLRESGVDLMGLWGYAESEELPRISCVPVNADAFRGWLDEHDIEAEEGRTFYLSETNNPGALVESLQGIADVGVNIDTIECVAAGEHYGCFIWSNERDWDELETLLT